MLSVRVKISHVQPRLKFRTRAFQQYSCLKKVLKNKPTLWFSVFCHKQRKMCTTDDLNQVLFVAGLFLDIYLMFTYVLNRTLKIEFFVSY